MSVAIIKYNAGNNYSVLSALNRLGVEALITDDEAELRSASKVIFPGVGEARAAMEYLRQHRLDDVIRSLTRQVLGICIGQQLMCRHSEEGDTDCLGIFDIDVVRFKSDNIDFKVPHMGWNTVNVTGNGVVPASCDGKYVYYVHSYYVPVNPYTTAVTEYIDPFSASLHKDNFYATQFHPEKSGDVGETIIKHFLEL